MTGLQLHTVLPCSGPRYLKRQLGLTTSLRAARGVQVKPQRWLPVALIEGRIIRGIQANLASIRDYAQLLYVHSKAAKPVL